MSARMFAMVLCFVLLGCGARLLSKRASPDGRHLLKVSCMDEADCEALIRKHCKYGYKAPADGFFEPTTRVRCKSPVVTISYELAARPMQDYSAQMAGRRGCKQVMLVRPRDAADDVTFEASLIEAQFIRHGTGVTSAAVTGRVLAHSKVEGSIDSGDAEARGQLSVAERALVLARESNADCLVQFGGPFISRGDRFLVLRGTKLVETGRPEWLQAPSTRRLRVTGPMLTLRAKVVDVDSGSVLASVNVRQMGVDSLATTVKARVNLEKKHIVSPKVLEHEPRPGWASPLVEVFVTTAAGTAVGRTDASTPQGGTGPNG